jgi:hypothetical protein
VDHHWTRLSQTAIGQAADQFVRYDAEGTDWSMTRAYEVRSSARDPTVSSC